MKVLVIGVNHRTADLAVRERLALAGDTLGQAYERLRSLCPETESLILSTCNRTEIYVARAASTLPSGDQLSSFLTEFCGLATGDLSPALMACEDEAAVHHLFAVTSGLDSMVLGETQILGQVKRAYAYAHERGAVGSVLHTLFQRSFAVAKRLRVASGIGSGRMSVASVAVDFARQIYERFDDKVVVAIGAGQITKVMLRHLLDLQPGRLWLANRSPQRARELADTLGVRPPGVGLRSLEDLEALLIEADIVLTSTGSSDPIITASSLRPLLTRRRYRPLFFVDIAIPRDVEPSVGRLRNVYLYDLDDLQQKVSKTVQQRHGQVDAFRQQLATEAAACLRDIQYQDVGRLIKSLRQKLHELGRSEYDRTIRKIASAQPDQIPRLIEQHSHRLINKVLHLPLQALDERNGHDDTLELSSIATALRRLFRLDDEDIPAAASPANAGRRHEKKVPAANE